MIDIENKNIISLKLNKIIRYFSNTTSKNINILELNNENKAYLFSYIEEINNNCYISFHKFEFYNFNISQNNSYNSLINSNTSLNGKHSLHHQSSSITCIEIMKFNLIQCLYLDSNYCLTIGLFNEINLEFINSEIIGNFTIIIYSHNGLANFYKSILFKDEISILGYKLDYFSYKIDLQIKNVIYNNIESKYEIVNYLNFEGIKLNNNSNNEINLG